MPFWRYAYALHGYARLFLRLHGLSVTKKFIPSLTARLKPKPITRVAHMARLRALARKSTGGLYQRFRAAFRNLVAVQHAPNLAHSQIRARENLQQTLEHRFKKIASRHSEISPIDRIRNVFVTNAPTDYSVISSLPDDINNYEIGDMIGSGQNAAVYELSNVKKSTDDVTIGGVPKNLALKMMFNFDFNQPVDNLWKEWRSELVPLANSNRIPAGKMSSFRPSVKPHPNIVRMHTAFIGDWQQLAQAERDYPAIMPSPENYAYLPRNPKTLYLVMQRYQMTLSDYMDRVSMNYGKARVIFGQLMEAVAHLYDQKISHRDLKGNNILLNFDSEDHCPCVVLSDFGSSLCTGSWKLHLNEEGIERGGNIAHLPPEVIEAKPSENTWIDYSKADVWAAGLIGYEIFDKTWYSMSKCEPATNDDVDDRPLIIGTPLGRLMEDMLRKDPNKRVSPNVAADVLNLMLFKSDGIENLVESCKFNGWHIGSSLSELLTSSSEILRLVGERIEVGLDAMVSLFAAETVMAQRQIDPVECQLRRTLLGRLHRDHIMAAVEYFEER